MLWLLGCGAYVALHFAMYVLVLRGKTSVSGEHAILRFHLLSASLYSGALACLALIYGGSQWPAYVLGGVALHGIYSLSFLELWSLAQGSYSLDLLTFASENHNSTPSSIVAYGSPIGQAKRSARITGLIRLGLVRCASGHFALTKCGRIVANGLALVAWLVRTDRRD